MRLMYSMLVCVYYINTYMHIHVHRHVHVYVHMHRHCFMCRHFHSYTDLYPQVAFGSGSTLPRSPRRGTACLSHVRQVRGGPGRPPLVPVAQSDILDYPSWPCRHPGVCGETRDAIAVFKGGLSILPPWGPRPICLFHGKLHICKRH